MRKQSNTSTAPSLFGKMNLEGEKVLINETASKNFLIKYQDEVKPWTRYADYFASSVLTRDIIFREIKFAYKRHVIESDWSEKRLVNALHQLFNDKKQLNKWTIIEAEAELSNKNFRKVAR